MQNNQFLKVKNSISESENDFMELKGREEKIRREIDELIYKLNIVSKDDIDKFEEQEIKKIRPIKNN